jgi:hypothetical protein
MIDKRRLTQAALSVGMAGGLLSGVTLGLFTMGIKEHNRPDIVHALTAAIPGPPQLAHAASAIPPDEDGRYYVKVDNTGDGYDVAYRWEW